MIPILSLWAPILLSAVIVFVVSAVIHMVLPYHRSDFAKLPAETEVMEALRRFNIPPGDYMMPFMVQPGDRKDPAIAEKMAKGPTALITVRRNGVFNMGPKLAQRFICCVVVSVIAAALASQALPAGTHYRSVFHFVSIATFAAYTVAEWPNSIWYDRKWSTALKATFDGLLYGMLTAGTFGWLWPK